MTIAVLVSRSGFFPSLSHAVSAEGKKVRVLNYNVWKNSGKGFVQSRRDNQIEEKLEHVRTQAATPNWDGYGAAVIDAASVDHAKRFLLLLPSASPMPDVEVDPDGEVSFDWFGDEEREISISFSPLGEISYSALFGEVGYEHGQKLFEDEIPYDILKNIEAICSSTTSR